MTGDRRDELAAVHYDNIRSYTVILSLKFNSYASLAILFIISFSLCFVFEHETSYTTRMLAVFDFITVRKRAIKLSVKTFIIRSVHSKFHVIITSITAVGMLINLCLVLLLQFSGLLVPIFHFQWMKKS